MPYKYNPLLKLDLQKQQDVPEPPQITIDDELSDTSEHAVQNKVITTELKKITDTQKKKVPKFFSSIEELEEGEIGEFQGETTEEFVNGYFYKRGEDQQGITRTQTDQSLTLLKYVSWNSLDDVEYSPMLNSFAIFEPFDTGALPVVTDLMSWTSSMIFLKPGYQSSEQVDLYFIPQSLGVKTSFYVDNFRGLSGYLLPFAIYHPGLIEIPIFFENGIISVLINNQIVPIDSNWVRSGDGSIRATYSVYAFFSNKLYSALILAYGTWRPLLVTVDNEMFITDHIWGISQGSGTSGYDNMSTWLDYRNPTLFPLFSIQQVLVPSFQRVDTQPQTDLTTVNNAITALQNKFAALIKTVTINATNDPDEGLVPLGLNSANVVVLSVYCLGLMCVPCIGIGGSGMIGCAISEFAPWSIPPAVARDFIVTYIDKSVL